MKIVDRLVRLSLYVMIFLSLFLSWKIWSNSGSKELSKSSNTGETSQTLKQAKDVFLPTQVIYHNPSNKYLYSNKESLITNIMKELLSYEWDRVSNYHGKKDADVLVEGENTLALLMPDEINLNYFFEINQLNPKQSFSNKDSFNRIVISFKEEAVYFIDERDKTGYKITLNNHLKSIINLLDSDDTRFVEVKYRPSNLAIAYYIDQQPVLKKYSYILGMQSYTVFSQAFFSSKEEILSNTGSENSKDVNLLSDAGSNLTVRYSTGEILFSGRYEGEPNIPEADDNIYNDTYYYVQKLASSMGTIRYFEGTDNRVVYRNYVEGFPIFSPLNKAQIEISKVNKNVQIATNQETIQVPIPSEEKVTLKNTGEVLADLEKAGLNLKEIQALQIGYTWILNDETKQVIDLVPEWYLKVNGIWESSNTIIKRLHDQAGEK